MRKDLKLGRLVDEDYELLQDRGISCRKIKDLKLEVTDQLQ